MGGKVWSVEEERTFWTHIIPRSQKRVGVDAANTQRSWDELALDMKEAMGANGRREYTSLGLFEHFFQNAVKQRFSPNAGRFAREYIERARNDGGETLRDDGDIPRRRPRGAQRRGRRRDEEIQARASPRTRPNQNRASPKAPARAKLSQKAPANNEDDEEEERPSPPVKRDNEENPSPASPPMNRDEDVKPSPIMKRERQSSPLRDEADSEVELPPFIPRDVHPAYREQYMHSSPGYAHNDYPVVLDSDDWDDEDITNSSHRYGPSPGVPRGRTAQMEARMERRALQTPSRIRQASHRGTPGSAGFSSPGAGYRAPRHLDDPFVDPNTPLHRDRDVVMGNGPDAHQNPAHYRGGNGMPSGNVYHPYGNPQTMGLGMTGSEYYRARQGQLGQQLMGVAHHEDQWNVRSNNAHSSHFRDAVDRANQHHAAQRAAAAAQSNEAWQQQQQQQDPSAGAGHRAMSAHSHSGSHGQNTGDDHDNERNYRGSEVTTHGPDYSSSYYHPSTSNERQMPQILTDQAVPGPRGSGSGDMPPPPAHPHHQGGRQGGSSSSSGDDEEEPSNTSRSDKHEADDDEDKENTTPRSPPDAQQEQQHTPERRSSSGGDNAQDVAADADAEGEEDPDEPEPQQVHVVTNIPAKDQPHDDEDEDDEDGAEGEAF